MELIFLRIAATLIATAIATYTDIKTGYIYDKITYPLIAFGIIINLIEGEFTGILLGGAIFAIGYVLYITGKFGGGDVKLFAGIAMAMPFYMQEFFAVNVIIFSALTATVFYGAFYTIKYARKGIDLEYNKDGIINAIFAGVIIAAYFILLNSYRIIGEGYISIFALPVGFALVFMALEKGIRKEFFLKKIKLKEMEEDEIIAYDMMQEKERKIFGEFKKVIEKKSIEKITKAGIKELLVYRNLPRFGPFIFAGTIIALLFPGLIFAGV